MRTGIPQAENGSVRTRGRLAGLLRDTVGDLVLTQAAPLLVYPHRVLVIFFSYPIRAKFI